MTDFYNTTQVFCSGGTLQQWVGDHFYEIKHVMITGSLGHHEENFERQAHYANPRLWSLVIAPYDAEAAYVLSVGSEEGKGPKIGQAFSGTQYPGGQAVFGGQTKYEFYHIDPYGEFWWETTLTDMARDIRTAKYLYNGVFNLADYPDVLPRVELEPSSYESVPSSYKVYSPHGSIDLPVDGYWPTLFPESILEGLYMDQQPVRALFSYTGDGLYFTEEGSPADKGGYPVGAPGIMAFFIGGA
jgi:hypothetical protein